MKLTALAIIIHPLLILSFTCPGGDDIRRAGRRYQSRFPRPEPRCCMNTPPLRRTTAPGFEGLADNSYFWNMTTGIGHVPGARAVSAHCDSTGHRRLP